MNLPAVQRDLQVRDGAHLAHAASEHRVAGDLDLALFRRVRRGDRRRASSEIDGVSYGAFIVPGLIMLSLLTQSISNASFGIYLPKLHRHDLRGPVGAGVVRGDRDRLRRRGGDEIDHPRPDHPGDGGLFVPLQDRASRVDGACFSC